MARDTVSFSKAILLAEADPMEMLILFGSSTLRQSIGCNIYTYYGHLIALNQTQKSGKKVSKWCIYLQDTNTAQTTIGDCMRHFM